ncbi:aminodeoxychorismate lyase [Salinisphaera sp. Q1T1-3]|uniref:aminodeoxychorismate lyase n=1 Tax=Salinisphaera sp. Q1T1-3 TaxID=2321229 RepID=UPI001313EE2D|nr:aminodeoxychorismate lyase [Salinisphaera sp. Q1T1-3]
MGEQSTVRIDGCPVGHVASDDRGLAYGDGIFRTLCVIDGHVVALESHAQRLRHDCDRLALSAPPLNAIVADIDALCGVRGRFVVKIMITRGSGGRGYTPPLQPMCRRIVARHDLPDAPRIPLTLAIADVRLAEQPQLAGVKHLNRLEQVLARRECVARNAADLAMCDASGQLTATTMRNLVFSDAAGQWHTPSLARAGVIGATRQRLMASRAARHDPVTECRMAPDELKAFTGAIACNSVGGAIAVAAIGDHHFEYSEAMAAHATELLEETA